MYAIFATMLIPATLQSFVIANTRLEIFVPHEKSVQQLYANKKAGAYWARVWPASISLCNFLQQHPQYVINKTVLELAAGLGLPGLYAAFSAKHVYITDREVQAVEFVQQSANHLKLLNVNAKALNWNDAMHAPLPEVLLLSDVNYEPEAFEALQQVLQYFLEKKVTIIISTPQRLIARQFINSLLPFCIAQWNDNVLLNKKETWVSVFVLKL